MIIIMKKIKNMPFLIPSLLTFILLVQFHLKAQNLPDRIVILDPLGDTTLNSDGFTLLPGTRLYGEFGYYTDGTEDQTHRWNAKMGGYAEFARWDSTWSIALVGTMEVIVDPLNDISFNPRAIFWEEGLTISTRTPWSSNDGLQFGYTHRCKHDIDNIEVFDREGGYEQRTLIYSGPFLRFLDRPTKIIEGPIDFYAGSGLRLDYFVHTLDNRWDSETAALQPNVEDLIGSLTASVRIEGRFKNEWLGFHGSGSYMLSLTSPDEETTLHGNTPFAEFGLDFYNPTGSAFTVFARGEWQRDASILMEPKSVSLVLLGVRASSFGGMW